MPLIKMCRKKDTLPYNKGGDTLLATTTKLLDIKCEFYRSGGDLIETNN